MHEDSSTNDVKDAVVTNNRDPLYPGWHQDLRDLLEVRLLVDVITGADAPADRGNLPLLLPVAISCPAALACLRPKGLRPLTIPEIDLDH